MQPAEALPGLTHHRREKTGSRSPSENLWVDSGMELADTSVSNRNNLCISKAWKLF
jgi:hypothetical protein